MGDHVRELTDNPDAIELPGEHVPHAFVAEDASGRVLGFAVVLPREDGDAELDGLFVEPDAWRRGIGARLVDEAARRARDAGARSLHVVANERALAFYAACGFEVTGQVMTRFAPAPTMRKTL
ncbi:GNAT family N-acetyltransferase [Phenylobacterium sp.]|uniref:GNAT family N-acetyltransferase n=1 Tax=Phenylobacterium sp. TaxID=1871053 RepID=UPI00391B4221